MSQACVTCAGKEFSIENCERICTNCGDVQEEFPGDPGDLCMIPDGDAAVDNFRNKNYEATERLTDRIRGETNSADTRRHISREKLLDEMRRVVKQLIKHPNAVDETMDLISSTLKAYSGRLLTSKKQGFAGACIYYMSAKHQLGISLTDICKTLNIRMKVINVCLKQVRSSCPDFEYERPNIKDLVKKFIDDMATQQFDTNTNAEDSQIQADSLYQTKRSKSSCYLIDHQDKSVLQDRVMLLIDLFESMHPYNQPTPQRLISAVTYHAWRSLDTFKMIALNLKSTIQGNSSMQDSSFTEHPGRLTNDQPHNGATIAKHSISFERFCQLCNLKYSSNCHKIVSKLQSSLLMLGRHVGDVNKVNLPMFLKDIIDNSPHLIKEHRRSEPQTSADTES